MLTSLFLLSAIGLTYAAAPACTGTNVTAEQRQMFIDVHNNYRRQLAKGLVRNKCGKMPQAKNMFELNYDCNLEQAIYAWASKCEWGAPDTLNGSYISLTRGGVRSTAPLTTANMNMSINGWWGTLQTYGAARNLTYIDTGVYPWQIMANSNMTAFACAWGQIYNSSKSPPYSYSFVCTYNNANGVGEKIYENGTYCKVDADCTVLPSTCNDGLCQTSSMSGPPETSNICPPQGNMNDAVRLGFLNRHNELKSRGVRGLEVDGKGGYAPKGSSSLKYIYDCDIEAKAIEWGKTCYLNHSSSSFRQVNGEYVGENLYMAGTTLNPKNAGKAASDLWWRELAKYGVGPENNLTQEVFASGVGHYSQMAWGNSYKLGCAVQYCPDASWGMWVICQYGPGGNMYNKMIYKLGEPCSGCNATQTCDPEEGLCIMP